MFPGVNPGRNLFTLFAFSIGCFGKCFKIDFPHVICQNQNFRKFAADILRIWWLTKRLKVVNCIFPISYQKYSIHVLSHRAQKFYFSSPAKQNYLDATFYKNLIWMRNRRIRTIYNNVHNFYCKPPFYLECFIFTGWTTPFTFVSRKLCTIALKPTPID